MDELNSGPHFSSDLGQVASQVSQEYHIGMFCIPFKNGIQDVHVEFLTNHFDFCHHIMDTLCHPYSDGLYFVQKRSSDVSNHYPNRFFG